MVNKYEYDSDDFYKKLYTLCSQGLTDREIANVLRLDASTLSRMKNGKYDKWTKAQNEERSERICQVLARGRAKINAAVRAAYFKAAIGGKVIKGKTKRYLATKCDCGGSNANCPNCHGRGLVYSDYYAVVDETEQELPPNSQAMKTWLLHHDEEWRKIERKEDVEDVPSPDDIKHGVDIKSWISKETEK